MKEMTEEERMLATTECATWGHDLSPALVGTEPVGMVCKRCDKSWALAGDETKLEPTGVFSVRTESGKSVEMVILDIHRNGRMITLSAQDRASWELNITALGQLPKYQDDPRTSPNPNWPTPGNSVDDDDYDF